MAENKIKYVLAPMAGVTDPAYRQICAELGVGVTVTEMVSSRALVYQDKKSKSLLKKNTLSLCGAQIFGNDPEIMAQADENLIIPMNERCESLNAAIAATIVMWQMHNP